MGFSRELSYDPITRTRKIFHADETGTNYTVEKRQDVTDILERNKALMAQTDERARWGEMTQVASVPLAVYEQWIQDGVIDRDGNVHDDKAVLRVLQDPEWAKLRTRPGRLV